MFGWSTVKRDLGKVDIESISICLRSIGFQEVEKDSLFMKSGSDKGAFIADLAITASIHKVGFGYRIHLKYSQFVLVDTGDLKKFGNRLQETIGKYNRSRNKNLIDTEFLLKRKDLVPPSDDEIGKSDYIVFLIGAIIFFVMSPICYFESVDYETNNPIDTHLFIKVMYNTGGKWAASSLLALFGGLFIFESIKSYKKHKSTK